MASTYGGKKKDPEPQGAVPSGIWQGDGGYLKVFLPSWHFNPRYVVWGKVISLLENPLKCQMVYHRGNRQQPWGWLTCWIFILIPLFTLVVFQEMCSIQHEYYKTNNEENWDDIEHHHIFLVHQSRGDLSCNKHESYFFKSIFSCPDKRFSQYLPIFHNVFNL